MLSLLAKGLEGRISRVCAGEEDWQSGSGQNVNYAGMWLNWRHSSHSWDISNSLGVWFGETLQVVLKFLSPTSSPFLGIPHFSSKL